ncbi:response regulator transcription factor [Oceanicoccus sagamiensis]|uniref:DNA-binding response regulator n=1 Tax=Oceanicoccus sagamiensis TaxID=716816 RepID=A0A1X9NNJ3_9GAMM|nr:response regulator transcription factor [Oceanicoccus sagamiensis]ARN75463.1 DNA-binding response regulator [Oceanicoccus sagamiensis]
MRILIVEDEANIRQQLAESMQQNGYATDTAQDGKEGLYMVEEYPYDLAIIDLGLPEVSGIELIKALRQMGKTFPVLILTARSDWQDKVEGLEAGADDYVVKPFHIEEVSARINALLRRSAGKATATLNFGPLTIDTAAKTAAIDGQAMTLTSYEYNTLQYLAHHAGKVVSKTELTEHLYSQDFDRDSNVIEVFIGRLRKKIDPQNSLKPIATVRGQGYRFTLASTAPDSTSGD